MISRRARRAFTLVEALVSTTITAVAGSALLLGIASSIKTTDDVLDQALGAGLAQQLMDEVSGKIWCADPSVPYQYPLGPNAYEAASVCRERYDDIDDYVSISSQPPNDAWGITLGTDDGAGAQRDPNFRIQANYFARWQRSASVYYVNPANLSQALAAGSTSDFRAVEVKVNFVNPVSGARQVANLRRVFTYVPIQ